LESTASNTCWSEILASDDNGVERRRARKRTERALLGELLEEVTIVWRRCTAREK
jgi:hypothetical protein